MVGFRVSLGQRAGALALVRPKRVSSDRMDKAAVTGFGHVGFGVNRLIESTLTGALVTAMCRLAPGSSPSPGRRAVEGMRDYPDWWQRR